MNSVVQFRPRSPALRKAGAAHTRAIGAPMHRIPFAGEPMGAVCDSACREAYARRRAILWAAWKAQKDHGLPQDLSGWHISAKAGEALEALYEVHIEPPRGQGWQALKINVPAWQVAEGEGGLVIDQEPIEALPTPCTETLTMTLPAPRAALAATVLPAKARKAPVKRWKPPKIIFIMIKGRVCPLKLSNALS